MSYIECLDKVRLGELDAARPTLSARRAPWAIPPYPKMVPGVPPMQRELPAPPLFPPMELWYM